MLLLEHGITGMLKPLITLHHLKCLLFPREKIHVVKFQVILNPIERQISFPLRLDVWRFMSVSTANSTCIRKTNYLLVVMAKLLPVLCIICMCSMSDSALTKLLWHIGHIWANGFEIRATCCQKETQMYYIHARQYILTLMMNRKKESYKVERKKNHEFTLNG